MGRESPVTGSSASARAKQAYPVWAFASSARMAFFEGKDSMLKLLSRITLKGIGQALILCSIVAAPLKSLAQTCATQPSSAPPPPIYTCTGGPCSNYCPDGSVGEFIECSADWYYNNVPQFGTLTFVSETVNDGGEEISLEWSSQYNGIYTSTVNLVTPTQICPLYWVVAAPPPDAETCSADCVGDPINPSVGNVYVTEEDVKFAGPGTAAFRRFYNSGDATGIDGVPGWRHSYGRSIVTIYETPSSLYPGSSAVVSPQYTTPGIACTSGFGAIQASVSSWAGATAAYNGEVCVISVGSTVISTLPIQSYPIPQPPTTPAEYDLIRDDGQTLRYTLQSGVIYNPPGISIRLSVTGSGFTVTDDQDNVETYNTAGVLQSIATRAGVVQTISYDSGGLFHQVIDSFGNSLTVTRNAQGSIASIAASGGGTVHYGYDTAFRLASVTNLDSTTKSYIYSEGRFVNALTSIIDENGTTYSSWTYDPQERGLTSQLVGGASAETLVYASNGSVTATDALGAVRTFSYTRIGDINRVTSISGSQCPTCQESAATTYDNAGWVASRTDYNGNVTCYANDPVRGLELVRVEGFAPGSTCPAPLSSYTPQSGTLQRKITTQWNSTWREPSLITEANRTTSLTFDGSGNVLTRTVTDTTVTPNVTRTWTFTYNAYGQVLTANGPRTDVLDKTIVAYYNCATGAKCGQVKTVTNALTQVTTYNTYNAYGEPLTITDPNGVLTTLTYDARLRLTSQKVSTEITGYSYYPTGLLKQVTQPDSSFDLYTYDPAHRLTQISDGAGNNIVYTLDAMGNHTADNTYDPSSMLHRTHTRVYNTLNELYQDINAANTSAVTTTYGYDSNGNQTSIEAPLSRNTANIYDALNRVQQITDPGSGNTYFAYDVNDNLTTVEDPRTLTTSYTYTGFGDLKTQVSPDTGTTTNTYDSGGNLAKSTDARNTNANYVYDALNRPTSVAYKKGSVTDQTITFTYDAGTNGIGRLTGASDANHYMSWTYDALGRITGKGQTVGTVTKSVGYAYTNADLVTLTTSSGQTLTYGYNTNHQIVSITLNGTTTILNNVTYEPLGPVNGWTWGNSAMVTRSYNTDGVISQISATGVKTLTYDDALRIQNISDTSTGASAWTYGYDLLDRITSGVGGSTTRGWTYDANGNRSTETGSAASTYTISPTNNQISSITGALPRTYSYDAAGHVLKYSTVTATYYDRGRLETLKKGSVTETLIYNALGQMVQTSGGAAGTVLYMYDEAGHLLGEYSSTGALIEETVWLGDLPVATLQPSGSSVAVYYIEADHINTPRQITRPSDNKQMWTWFSDPFGTTAANSNPAGAGTFIYNLRFPGQIFDSQAGLQQNYFRDYDPAVGRYIESDPIGLFGGSYATYAYANGRPVSGVDPRGRATAVVVGGPTSGGGAVSSNPLGHAAIATTGSGVDSYGTSEPFGSSLTRYLTDQATYRADVVVVLPNTTPEQENAIIQAMNSYASSKPYNAVTHNCATAVINALDAANILPANPFMPPSMFGGSESSLPPNLPSTVLNMLLQQPGAQVYYIPQGGAIPAALSQFNPPQ
jgi:RHS repeat-associated protein